MKIKITPDKERAKSILNMIGERENFVRHVDQKQFATIAAENYYEIIKELCTAVALSKGFKFIGENAHKELIGFIQDYGDIKDYEIMTIHDLRIRRNKSSYEGKPIEEIYLVNKKEDLLTIIRKLKRILEKEL
jgi:hypothetical protein